MLNITRHFLKTQQRQPSGTREKGRKHQCHFSRIMPVHTWLLAPWAPSRNWNGTFYHILHIVWTLLPQTITSLAPWRSIWAEKGFAIMRKWYRMFRSGYTGNQKTSSWAASASFWTAGAGVLQTREIILKSNNFSFGE